MAVRRAVLGEEHVERAQAGTTEFTRDFQELITRYAWGEIWTRPGLDRKTRSLLTIAILASLGRSEELRLHVRATRNTGATRDEVREALLQVAVYAGVPAANSRVRARGGRVPRARRRGNVVIAPPPYARERAGTQPPYDYPGLHEHDQAPSQRARRSTRRTRSPR